MIATVSSKWRKKNRDARPGAAGPGGGPRPAGFRHYCSAAGRPGLRGAGRISTCGQTTRPSPVTWLNTNRDLNKMYPLYRTSAGSTRSRTSASTGRTCAAHAARRTRCRDADSRTATAPRRRRRPAPESQHCGSSSLGSVATHPRRRCSAMLTAIRVGRAHTRRATAAAFANVQEGDAHP